MSNKKTNFFSLVTKYLKLRDKLKEYLSQSPHDWNKFQDDFNTIIDKFSVDITKFEKNNIGKDESAVYRLRKVFENRYRKHFLYGDLVKWSYEKPFGYAGDFQIIDYIYGNSPVTIGFDRLWDNYFQQMAASKATRERKEDFKKIISDFVVQRKDKDVRIMDLASGPAREIKELIDGNKKIFKKVTFDCYDLDNNAIEYAGKLLKESSNVNFFQKNAIRLALKKDITAEIPKKYDLIYSTGLFDYLDDRVSVRLIGNLKKLLNKKGVVVISNYRDKDSNTSACLMEWIADWNLIYRTEENFANIFQKAGFPLDNVTISPQQSNVMQYCFAQID